MVLLEKKVSGCKLGDMLHTVLAHWLWVTLFAQVHVYQTPTPHNIYIYICVFTPPYMCLLPHMCLLCPFMVIASFVKHLILGIGGDLWWFWLGMQ